MITKPPHRVQKTPAGKAALSPMVLLHLLPLAVLALPLLGLIASDFLRDLKKSAKVEVLEEPVAKKAPSTQAPKAEVLDEPDEVVVLPARFKIDDEPEER